jgi:hypothetical protein
MEVKFYTVVELDVTKLGGRDLGIGRETEEKGEGKR